MTADVDPEGYPPGLSPEAQAFQRLYGPWRPFTPAEARAALADLDIPWWVAGGWAIEAFTGVPRDHEDIDVSIFRRDLPVFRERLGSRYHVWAAGPNGLTPLDDQQMTLPDEADQVWIRAHALSAWRADVLLNPDVDGRWVFRRDRSYDAPLDEVTWEQDGMRYLRPEIALAFKAKHVRDKDQADFAATVPLLEPSARAWLAETLERLYPDHAWRKSL